MSISVRTEQRLLHNAVCAQSAAAVQVLQLAICIENQIEYKFRSKLNDANSSFRPTEVPLGPYYYVC